MQLMTIFGILIIVSFADAAPSIFSDKRATERRDEPFNLIPNYLQKFSNRGNKYFYSNEHHGFDSSSSEEYGEIDYNSSDSDAEEDSDFHTWPKRPLRRPKQCHKHEKSNKLREQRDQSQSLTQNSAFDMQMKAMENSQKFLRSMQQMTSDFVNMLKI